ncbi:MAG TPA: GNAT family N-acetyltransferase [Anaerolineales bacterium]|nr:GNAT family N-acetyltransferase [Anaerolineales bacterium]
MCNLVAARDTLTTQGFVPTGRLRPLDVQRDLLAVADLIALAFGERLDAEGHSLIRHMRQAARDRRFLRWAARQGEIRGMPLSGYVWEEEGRIVGNLSLIPMGRGRRRVYLIANVAVHPARRRQGIARQLVRRALEHVRQRRVTQVWLQVDVDNRGAVALYEALGFRARHRRRLWRWVGLPDPPQPPGLRLTPLRRRDAQVQQAWLRQAYPGEIAWFYPLDLPRDLAPTPLGLLRRWLGQRPVRQVAVRGADGETLRLSLARLRTRSAYDALYLAAPQLPATEALALAGWALCQRASQPVLLEVPFAEDDDRCYPAAGFALHRDLLWMRWDGALS